MRQLYVVAQFYPWLKIGLFYFSLFFVLNSLSYTTPPMPQTKKMHLNQGQN